MKATLLHMEGKPWEHLRNAELRSMLKQYGPQYFSQQPDVRQLEAAPGAPSCEVDGVDAFLLYMDGKQWQHLRNTGLRKTSVDGLRGVNPPRQDCLFDLCAQHGHAMRAPGHTRGQPALLP